MALQNIFVDIPQDNDQEIIEELIQGRDLRIKRIVSRGQASPPGFWYDQDEDEWVLLISGKARIQFEGQAESLVLAPGDHLHIPAHTKHRVEWTDASQRHDLDSCVLDGVIRTKNRYRASFQFLLWQAKLQG